MRIKITQEAIEAARQKNQRRRQLGKITISREQLGKNRSGVLGQTEIADADWKTITIPRPSAGNVSDEPESPTLHLPYVGQEDPWTKDVLKADDEVVRCQKCGFYHLKGSWEEYGQCGNCRSTEYDDSLGENVLSN